MSGYPTCAACRFDGDIFPEELASIEEDGLCIACKFDVDVANKLMKLREEDNPTETTDQSETSRTTTKGES